MKLLNNLLTSLTQYENEMIQIRRHYCRCWLLPALQSKLS